MEEKEIEIERNPEEILHSLSSQSENSEDGTSTAEADIEAETGFEPIQSRGRQSIRRDSRELSVTRSNNGYGVDDLEEDLEPGETMDPEPGNAPAEKDPFEVVWDNGDADPSNPRSMPLWRKWLIVGITSFGSFCV